MELKGEIDRSEEFFRTAGSVPFQWETKPGVPKHKADADAGSPPPKKLPPPPAMRAAASPSLTPLSRSSSSTSAGGPVCFPSISFRYRSEKRALKIFSLLRRRSVSDRFVPRSSPSSSPTEEDEFDVGSSGRSLTPSDASSF